MRIALTEPKLDRLFVVCPGGLEYETDAKVRAVPLEKVMDSGGAALFFGAEEPSKRGLKATV